MPDHHINLFYSEEDGEWIADVPDLSYCSALGQTPQEALTQVLIAKEAWLHSAKAAGKQIHEPTYRPVTAS